MERRRDRGLRDRPVTRAGGRRPGATGARGVLGVLGVLLVLGAVAGCTPGPVPTLDLPAASTLPRSPGAPASAATGPATASPSTAAGSTSTGAATVGVAAAAASLLPVKGRAPMTGYDRDEFGSSWTDDVGHVLPVSGARNGCDQRNDVLRRDLRHVVLKPGTHGCVAASGTLRDPYTGGQIAFVRGPRSAEVQIDHVVALADAWQKGAQQWDALRRRDFAGDPLNLLAVEGSANQSKGAGDAATWLPPQRGFRCDYAARIVAVKAKYGVWVTAAEKAALLRILAGCPGQSLPTGASIAVPVIAR